MWYFREQEMLFAIRANFFTRSATIFREISSAILKDIIWLIMVIPGLTYVIVDMMWYV